jgi:hypothetical protein
MFSHSGAASLPKGFRFHHPDIPEPKTPEPCASANDEMRPPSPPRPRLRLKRRVASHLAAPTQQFLASVAAADVPIPSIEEPNTAATDDIIDEMVYPVIPSLQDLPVDGSYGRLRGRLFSPPKTPAPGSAPSLSPKRYPDWSIESSFSSTESSPESDSSTECESSRPSTARSTHTSASLYSRLSLNSDDEGCTSPDANDLDIFESIIANKEPRFTATNFATANTTGRTRTILRKAPWTKAMSDHLWAVYIMYLQDPKVTPFNSGKSCIPPHGVCLRVAREAKRSWKGSKPLLTAVPSPRKNEEKSGSTTPTAEAAPSFIEWPHTCAATRSHLRELCRVRGFPSAIRTHSHIAHSPTPFGRTATRYWNRRSTPARSSSVFAAQDLAFSLAISTSESMQPGAPLAQLTSSSRVETLQPVEEPISASTASVPEATIPFPPLLPMQEERRHLGSPFVARSYGPSSSGALLTEMTQPGPGIRRQTHTVGLRRNLQSPVRLTRSRSNTQKRRSRPGLLETRKPLRPSLVSDLWTAPPIGSQANSSNKAEEPAPRPSFELNRPNGVLMEPVFAPRMNVEELIASADPQSKKSTALSPSPVPEGLMPPVGPPARLGSPFSASASSFSFPNRFSQPDLLDFSAVRRPFATVQQGVDDLSAARPNLATRLTYINERLREIRHRDHARRRSESPL